MVSASCQHDPVAPEVVKPKVLSLLPKAGYPGTSAVISGYGFTEPATVSVDGVQASVTSVTIDRIYFKMPEHELGNVAVSVTTGGETLTGLTFRYAEPVEEEKLAIFSYTPASGIEGDQITISGQLRYPFGGRSSRQSGRSVSFRGFR